MSLRYLYGPIPRNVADQKLHRCRQSGACLTFHADEGEGDILIRPEDSWDDVRRACRKAGLRTYWSCRSPIPPFRSVFGR